jgi:hypothetical protein
MFVLLTKQCPAWQGAVFFFMEKTPSVIMAAVVAASYSCLSLQDNKEKINGR